jgi:methionyl-tRNA formyltransferase
MEQQKIKTIFFGSGSFAVKILQGILKLPFLDVVAVVTQPDKPAGRDKILTPCPVKAELNATQFSGKVYAPEKLKTAAEKILTETQPDFILVADYGQFIPNMVIEYPKYKCLNVHGSPLPDLRGAVPAAMAILKGYKITGVSIPVMTPRLDDGAVVASKEIELMPEDNTYTLRMRLAEIGNALLLDVLPDWFAGKIVAVPQDESKATITKQSDIAKEKAQICKTTSSIEAERMIRAFNPWPIAWCELLINGKPKRLKIITAKLIEVLELDSEKYKIIKLGKKLYLRLDDGILELEELQLEGKNIGKSTDYLFLANSYLNC